MNNTALGIVGSLSFIMACIIILGIGYSRSDTKRVRFDMNHTYI